MIRIQFADRPEQPAGDDVEIAIVFARLGVMAERRAEDLGLLVAVLIRPRDDRVVVELIRFSRNLPRRLRIINHKCQ